MKLIRIALVLLLSLVTLLASTVIGMPAAAAPADGYLRVGYFTQWGIYKRDFLPKNLVTTGIAAKLTHINYAFANVGPDGRCFEANEAGVGDAWADYQQRYRASESVDGVADVISQPLAGNFNQLRKLKQLYPGLKVLLSIGGWSWSKYLSDAALTPASRQALVSSCIDMFIKGNLPLIGTSPHGGPGSAAGVFDGFDLDWEWPGSPGNAGNIVRPEDKHNYTLLAAEFRSQLDAYGATVGRTFQLSAFLPADPVKIAAGIETAPLLASLDFATVQGYDFVGAWDLVTGHQSNLYSTPQSQYSVDLAIDTYLAQGAPAAKLVIGVPFYGRGWTGVGATNNGLFQTATGPARGTYESGVDDYKKVVTKSGTVFYDSVAGAAWKFGNRQFWSYDTPPVIAQKMAYVKDNGLGGAMAWSLDGDTATGQLTTAIVDGLS